jgi:hypothetical protein
MLRAWLNNNSPLTVISVNQNFAAQGSIRHWHL